MWKITIAECELHNNRHKSERTDQKQSRQALYNQGFKNSSASCKKLQEFDYFITGPGKGKKHGSQF